MTLKTMKHLKDLKDKVSVLKSFSVLQVHLPAVLAVLGGASGAESSCSL